MSPLDAAFKKYKSFVLTKYLPLDELKCTLIEAVHEPTGARIIHIANDDPENLFCLSFQTLPYSSNGIAHILEHTVLCGSKKFPIKDPFFSMIRRSLNTYMNALTGQDFTCYPASSQIEKDFYNIFEVYLDAVFHPELKKKSFLQEGHRLEFAEPKNPESPLQFQGVVYNEMKGAMSSIESRLWQSVMKRLTPDLPYSFNSGGDPKEIPELSHEELIEFHKTFYHPSRCLFFFYGNLPLSKHFDFLLKNALSGVEKVAPLPPLPVQKRFSAPVFGVDRYPINESESIEKKTLIAFSWLTTSLTNQGEVLALCLLDSLLMDTDASPLKMALLKSGLCAEAESSIDVEMSEIPFSIVCKGCEAKDAEALKKIIYQTLENCRFTNEDIEASLHQLEFQRTEIGAEGIPFGLTLFFRAGIIKQHGSEPENALLIHSLFNDLRNRLSDPDYLPNLLKKHLTENIHFTEVILKPDPKLSTEERKEEEERLSKIRPKIDEKAIVKQAEELAAYQEEVESQSSDCLPKLSLKDVPTEARDFQLSEQKEKNLTVFHHGCFTNQVLYADLIYDLPDLPASDLPLLSLFSRFLTELGCGGRSYSETLAYSQAYTGGVEASISLHTQQTDPDLCKPTLSLRGKALKRNSSKLLSLFGDIFSGADFTDKSRVQELLMQQVTALQNRLTKSALNYAIHTAMSAFSSASFAYNQWHGLPFYHAVMKWAKQPELLIEELSRIQKTVLGRGTPHLVLSCDENLFSELNENQFFGLSEKLPQNPIHPWLGNYPLAKIEPQVRFIASPVAFTVLGMRSISYKDPKSPLLLLTTELLDNCHLHKEIREKGGAYGSGASYSPSNGNFHLYSYRDPHLAKTIATFQKALEKIGNMRFTERDLEEAKFGVLQTLDAPVAPGNRAIVAYSWKRAGRTYQDRQNFRQKILSAKREDVADAVNQLLLPAPNFLVSFLGEDLYQKEKKKLKQSLSILEI